MRGYRNNNPCNIRCSKDKWDGEVIPSQDKAFKQFKTMSYGFRAVFKLLHNYNTRSNCRTLTQMINRFAPPVENHTDVYIKRVADSSHIDPNSPINTLNRDIMVSMVTAMATVENGKAPKAKDVADGWDLFITKR